MDKNYQKDELDNTPIVELAAPPSNSTIPLSNRYQIAATSDNTRRAYQADIRHFENWGGKLPATTEAVLRYLHAFAETLNSRTLSRHITALKQWHRYQRLSDPTEAPIVSKTLTGIARLHGKPKDKAPPLLPEHLIRIADCLATQSTLAAFRDNALLQIGFLGAFRRSELVAIKLEDIHWQPAGIEILITKSKTDQLNMALFPNPQGVVSQPQRCYSSRSNLKHFSLKLFKKMELIMPYKYNQSRRHLINKASPTNRPRGTEASTNRHFKLTFHIHHLA